MDVLAAKPESPYRVFPREEWAALRADTPLTLTEDDVRRLRFIRSAQMAGFTLEEIGELLALDASADRARAREIAHIRITALDAKLAELTAARAALSRLAEQCSAGDAGPCPIIAAFEPVGVEGAKRS